MQRSKSAQICLDLAWPEERREGGNSIFLGDNDFKKLGIGGLDSEFNPIFGVRLRRRFGRRISFNR